MPTEDNHSNDLQDAATLALAAGLEVPARYFNECFKHWDIKLPSDAAVTRRGEIGQKGWGIRWIVGRTKKGVYLEFYAGHRMTDDNHERIYEDGTVEHLETFPSFCVVSDDPIENDRIQKEYMAEKRRIWRRLSRRGVWPTMREMRKRGAKK